MPQLNIPVAYRRITELVRIRARDHGGIFRLFGSARHELFRRLIALTQSQRNKVVRIGLQRGDDRSRNGLQHTIEVEIGDTRLAKSRKVDAVRRLPDLGIVRNLRSAHQFR